MFISSAPTPKRSKTAHRQYSIEEKMSVVKKFIESGLNLSKFASMNNLTKSALHKWVQNYNNGSYLAINNPDIKNTGKVMIYLIKMLTTK